MHLYKQDLKSEKSISKTWNYLSSSALEVLKTLQQTAGRETTYMSAAEELLRQDGVRGKELHDDDSAAKLVTVHEFTSTYYTHSHKKYSI